MRRSIQLMVRMMEQQQSHLNPDSQTLTKKMMMNVITLVSPNINVSQQMIHELQKWTTHKQQQQQQQPTPPLLYEQYNNDGVVDNMDDTTIVDHQNQSTTTATMMDNTFHHYHNPINHDDMLNDWVRTKHTKKQYNIFRNVWRQDSQVLDIAVTADSVVWCVGGGGGGGGGDFDTNAISSSTNKTLDNITIPTTTRTMLHFVSSNAQSNSLFSVSRNENTSNAIDLLAIQSIDVSTDSNPTLLVQEIRNGLVQLLMKKEEEQLIFIKQQQQKSLSWMDNIKRSIQQSIRRQQQQQQYYHRRNQSTNSVFTSLLQRNDFVPFIDLTASSHPSPSVSTTDETIDWMKNTVIPKWNVGELKEIVIPFDFTSTTTQYGGTTTFTDILSNHFKLHRPVTGLYRLPCSNICIRPIPMAKEDRKHCTSPTIIFHSDNRHMESVLQQQEQQQKQNHTTSSSIIKIGYTGRTLHGQLMITDKQRLGGIGIRLCPQLQPTSAFSEAQDSLLASSLSELQSQHVLRSSKSSVDTLLTDDPKTGNADCWVEFRATMRHPVGFLYSASSSLLSNNASPNLPKIAKAPDLPYE